MRPKNGLAKKETEMKKIFGNTVVFVLLYIIIMIPTYILPYMGSNSSMAIGGVSSGHLSVIPFLTHITALALLIVITWFRGSLVDKKWLLIFPILAAVFDFIPVLSSIPLVPTVMHLLAIILGVTGTKPPVTATETSS